MDKKTIVVAFGGVSPEHEVSVLTAMQAIDVLDRNLFRPLPLYIAKSGAWYTGDELMKLETYKHLDQAEEKGTPCTFSHDHLGRAVLRELNGGFLRRAVSHPVDVILPAFHGSEGENGSFQGLCETFNIPYAGSGVLASSVGMDKVTAKALCRAHGIPVVADTSFREIDWENESEEIMSRIHKLGYPVAVKPVHLGSSIGVGIADTPDQLVPAIEDAFRYDEELLVEKAIRPLTEINCSVIGIGSEARASVCEKPLGKEKHLSFTDKYLNEEGESKGMASADREIPADIPDELAEKIRSISLQVFEVFRASGVARLDFLINSETEELFFNEINTIPGSFSFYLWKESGTSFGELLTELVDLAMERHTKKNRRVRSYETNLLSQKAVKGLKGLKSSDKK